MGSTTALPVRPSEAPPGPAVLKAALATASVAAVLWAVSAAAVALLPWSGEPRVSPPFDGPRLVAGWAQWDAGWYVRIAEEGYSYQPGRQSSVVFFPAYPLLVAGAGSVAGDLYLAGSLVTVAAGVGAAAAFFAWAGDRLGPSTATTALALFVLYPYSFFLFGAVYADAVFVLCVVGAFLLLERDRPGWAGLVGAVATAARPMGAVLVVGLAVRAIERRREAGDRWRAADWGVLLSAAGAGAFSAFCWARFGDPLAFLAGQEAWGQQAGPATWLKLQFFEDVTDLSSPLSWLAFVAHPVLTVAALALVPLVFRRLGKGYGTYALALVGLSALSTKNFFGMARYLLAAFPCFAVVAELVTPRPRLRPAVLGASGLALLALTAAFARGHYLS